jgi:hypothetical protein
VRNAPARTLAAAGTATTGALAAAAAYLIVRGLPGLLYAGGICLAAFVGALAIVAGRSEATLELEPEASTPSAARPPLWRRKAHIIAGLEAELAATGAELEEHRHALANLATQLSRESEAAQRNAERLGLQQVVAAERERFEQTLDELGGGIGGHANELAELERELEALIAR